MHKMWLLALLLLVPGTQAALDDETDFEETYFARVAMGDIPRTAPTEGGGWNVVEYLRVQHDGNATQFTVDGLFAFTAACTCDTYETVGRTIRIPATVPAGEHIIAVRHSHTGTPAFSPPLGFWNTAGTSAAVTLYAPPGSEVTSNKQPTIDGLPGSQTPNTIYQFHFDEQGPLDGSIWFSIHPTIGTIGVDPAPADGFDFLALVIGLLVGIGIWAFLVQRGMVQRRRRQQVAVAAHEEVAKTESKASLEARKRVLMAGLKELEKAKANKEIDTEIYDALKAELKKEAVTAMRAMEGAQ